ncbi:MAG: ATP synthase F1 subunit delta [Chloracidobacterium sp.]|nr:ATP synthase F1 subunit delta [Chloracidobacterium sp.]MCC6824985.1 ATP synthase F1 subunit delta [Acidobacteriota bacterium]MCO5333373.1 ATP synthase F1 subunit delta [Pyrinomonadaceae bacterium]
MSVETIARRYGGALADIVINAGTARDVKSELEQFSGIFAESRDLHAVFANPAIPHLSKEKVLNALLERTKPSKTTANFLRVLVKNGRITELGEINERFDSILDERSGVVMAEIVSATEIAPDERAKFQTNLEKLTGKQVNVSYSIDKNIIGGVVTRIGSTVYDSSVRTKLQNLREQLING